MTEPITYLGTNEPSWLWNRDMGQTRLFISRRRFERLKSWKPARSRWALDSGGFTELSHQRRITEEYGFDHEFLDELYEAVYVAGEPTEIMVRPPVLQLVGAPPPDDGRTWQASLPSELSRWPQYWHLFPGHMPGFREHMVELLKNLPFVEYAFDKAAVEVHLSLPFDRPVMRTLPRERPRSLPGRVQVKARHTLALKIPRQIPGDTRAEAAARWDQLERDLLNQVGAVSVRACSACEGTGWTLRPAAEPLPDSGARHD